MTNKARDDRAEPIRRLAYTVDEAAIAAGTSPTTVREWTRMVEGLPCIHVGKKVIIRIVDLEKWLEKLAVGTNGKMPYMADQQLR